MGRWTFAPRFIFSHSSAQARIFSREARGSVGGGVEVSSGGCGARASGAGGALAAGAGEGGFGFGFAGAGPAGFAFCAGDAGRGGTFV
jgi:hypothetical protein